MQKLLIIGLILSLTNCSVSKQRLSGEKTIKNSFSESEIKDLQLLFDFFNESICDSEKNIKKCYVNFFNKAEQSADSNSLYLNIPFKKQLKIYNKLKDSTFYQIWAFGKTWNSKNSNDTLRGVHYNLNGKFRNFLNNTREKDEFINDYYKSVETHGEPSPAIIYGIIKNHKRLNIDDLKVKLIIAIHYLTLNDQYKRKEKYKKSG